MMRKKVMQGFFMFFMVLCLCGGEVRAEDNAAFQVKAGVTGADNTIRISVWLTGVDNLGGVEVLMSYNPDKVTFVESNLGGDFLDGYGETNCIEEESVVKCVSVYPERKKADGELFYSVFRLKEGESYQPEIIVNELFDSSVDIHAIPYEITYQMADGEWSNVPDTSNEVASQEIQKANQEAAEAAGKKTVQGEGIEDENEQSENEKAKEEIEKREKKEAEQLETTIGQTKKNNITHNYIYLCIVAGGVLVIFLLILWKRKNENKEMEK